MTKATAGPGFLIQMGDGANPENFSTVAEARDIKGPSLKADPHDVTNQSSPGGWDEYVVAVKRGGDVTFPVNWIPSDPTHNAQTGLLAAFNNRTLKNWKLLENDTSGKIWSFPAYVIGLDETHPVNGALEGAITLKISGQPVLA